VTVGSQTIHEEDRQGGVGHHRLGRMLVQQPFPAPVWFNAQDNDITRSVRSRLYNGRDGIPRCQDYVIAHPHRRRPSPRQHILYPERVPERVDSIGLQQAMRVEQADVEHRLMRQGSGVAYSCIALGGVVMHDEQARPVGPPIRFFWRFCDYEEGLSSRGSELLDNMAQPPVAPPCTRVRPNNDETAVFFPGST